MRYSFCALIIAAIITLSGCESERQLTVSATAFNSTRAQTDDRPLETACGDRLRPGQKIIAVSRDLEAQGLVCGTEVEISGLEGTWVVADRTARRHKELIDIYMGQDIKRARKWGRREVEITWRAPERSATKVRVAEVDR